MMTETFDLLVVGGGITGAGVARDAAMRGLKVALVERADYAFGTSSRSSKLVHGGLRYLENLEFGLVFEALRERAVQRRLNPHLVWPLPFIFPVYKTHRNRLWKIRLGLWLYDLLSAFRNYRWHRRLKKTQTLEHVPELLPEGLVGSVRYYDCRTDDARLTLGNVLDAARAGACTANYVSFDEPHYEGDRVVGATLTDRLTGDSATMKCKHIVFCGGPWTDLLKDAPGDGHLLRPTKGVHIVVDRERLPLNDAIVMNAHQDGRVVFAVPFFNATYIGTTDTDFDGDFDSVRATADDVSYLLETSNYHFPNIELRGEDVWSTWAGVRPLIRSDEASPGKTSREHQLYSDPRGITTIAGGKLTTYRAMAEEVVDSALVQLKEAHGVSAKRCNTHRVPLDAKLPPDIDPVTGPEDPTRRHLWRHFGSGAAWIQKRWESHPEEKAILAEGLPYTLAEITYTVLHEQAERLEDAFVRRLQLFFRDPDQGLSCAERVARHMAVLLGHNEAWVAAEVEAYTSDVERSRLGAHALSAHQRTTAEDDNDVVSGHGDRLTAS